MFFSVSRKKSRKSKKVLYKRNPSVCKIYKKSRCGKVDPNCAWRKKSGCVRRSRALRTKVQYAGPKWQSPKKFSSPASVKSFVL